MGVQLSRDWLSDGWLEEVGDELEEAAGRLVEFARGLAWGGEGARGQRAHAQVMVQHGRVVEVVYPHDLGKLTIGYDEHGARTVTRNGEVILERLTQPASDGECRWRVMGSADYRGRLAVKADGELIFSLPDGSRYIFKSDGTRENIAPADKRKEAGVGKRSAATTESPPAPRDILPWFKSTVHILDADKDGKVSARELFEAGLKQKVKGKDVQMTLALLLAFDKLDGLDKADDLVTTGDLEKLDAAMKEPSLPLRKEVQGALDEAHRRLSGTSCKLWGEFARARDAVKPEAVSQGLIGDCWLLSAVAAVAQTMPEVLEGMIEQKSDGTFTVRFAGADKPVTIDAPTDAELGFFAAGSKYGIWVAVLEKAAAKVWNERMPGPFRSDQNILALHGGDPGEAFALLTGKKVVHLSGQSPELAQKLTLAAHWELPAVAGSYFDIFGDSQADERGVYFSHAYTVSYDPKTRMVSVRNPWGGVRKSEPTDGNGRAKDGQLDGTFRLSLEEFARSFKDVWVVVP